MVLDAHDLQNFMVSSLSKGTSGKIFMKVRQTDRQRLGKT